MTEASTQVQRLQRVHEKAKDSLSISTEVALSGGMNAPATMYRMDIAYRSTHNKWSIAKRYSEFYAVRRQLRKLLKQYNRHLSSGSSYVALMQMLDDLLGTDFPRRHFRSDNNMIIAERRAALETFVQSLVKIVASIQMAIDAVNKIDSVMTVEEKQLVELYTLLRDFLEYPDKQIESETKLRLAVLSLEDVVVNSQCNLIEAVEGLCSNECCSICLSEWDDEECAGMNVVKLPCEHVFHEECLLEWLQGSAQNCPMCREEPKTAGPTVFIDDKATRHHDHVLKSFPAADVDRYTHR